MVSVIVSAIIYGACFPGTPFSLLVFAALVPFFISLRGPAGNKKAFAKGALFGAFYSTVLAYWIFNALYFHYGVNPVGSLLFLFGTVSAPMALLYGLFALPYRFLARDSLFFHGLVVPSLWVLCDFIRDLAPLYLPWGLAGYSLAGFPRLIQGADIVGVHGISFIIVAVNSLLALAWIRWRASGEGKLAEAFRRYRPGPLSAAVRTPLLIAASSIAALIIYGSVQVPRWRAMMESVPPEGRITARVVQGSFALRDRWAEGNVLEIYEASMKLTGDVKKGPGRFLVVWPETVLNAGTALRDAMIAGIIRDIGENALLIFGGTRRAAEGVVYNSAYFLSGRGAVKAYDKIILLPFAETTPWGARLLGSFYEAPVRFNAGSLPSVAVLENVAVGFSICFEKVFPWFVRRQASRGAALLVNISNDSWFGRSTYPYQSLDAAVLRAVENRRYMIVASNSGISAVVAPWGECAARTGLFTEERIDAEVRLMDEKSPYTMAGDIVLYLAVLFVAGALGTAVLKG